MSKIIKLDKTLANQIAAGEVVERPFSVVKELVENSIDAWATQIKVELKQAWIEEIIVIDNWEGIEKDDLKIVTQKYTTSKIKSLQDLYNIMTFGFRWEALASISSVSKFQIISKTTNSNFWYSFEVIDGKESDIKEYPCENWTKIIVKDLFYNTPARLNYLKKPKTEFSYISDFLKQISLSYPKIAIELINDGKKVFSYRQNEDLKTRIYNVFGEEFFNNLLEINFSGISWMSISWYISSPTISFGSNKKQVLFVNNRIIKSPIIFKAIKEAYNRFIAHQEFPWYVLNIKIDPTLVDVNVHPRKQEVRFAQESEIYRLVYHSIQDKLDSVSLLKSSPQPSPIKERELKTEKFYVGSWTKFKSYSPYKNISSNPNQWQIKEAFNFSKKILENNIGYTQINNIGQTGINIGQTHRSAPTDNIWWGEELSQTPLWKIIWQMHNSYILVQTDKWLTIFDQHALAERIIYEKLLKQDSQKKVSKQWLLFWEKLELTEKQVDIVDKYIDIFENMWFELEITKKHNLLINAIPDFIKKEKITSIFEWVIEDIWEIWSRQSLTLKEIKNKIFAYTACRSAIKFGHKLSFFEMNKLLNDAILDYSSTCPHWRPVVYSIDLMELQGKYER